MDSQDMTITYNAIKARANDDALEAVPDLPNTDQIYLNGTTEEDKWSMFMDTVESVDAYEVAAESSEWDWVIYYHRAMQLCQAVPSDVLSNAESEWHELGAYMGDNFGLYEFATMLAAFIVQREIVEAVESIKEELIELAENQMEQF